MTAPLSNKIRVLVVDDSPMYRKLLITLLENSGDVQVVGQASNGLAAVKMTNSLRPQVVAMDITMPIMDGLQAAKTIMQETPTPVVLLGTAEQLQDPAIQEQVTASGAVDFCEKPPAESGDHLVKTLRAMSQVSVIRLARSHHQTAPLSEFPGIIRRPEIILFVASTGGPQALSTIITRLPPDFPLPIVIVQHISDEFVDNMTNWLDGITPLVIKMAEHGERPLPGYIYIAPIGMHLRMSFNGRFSVEPDTENYRHIPSGDVLLESAAESYGANAIGVVLTGMGEDGARGLFKMREQGAHTIVQDEATSIVFGMPKAAIDMGGCEFIVSLQQIPELLVHLAKEGREDE